MRFSKTVLLAASLVPCLAMAQTFPSPTFNAVTLQTPLTVSSGGTGASSASAARSSLSAAASGTNSDIKSLTGLTTPLSVAQGGTGVTTSTGTGSSVLSASPALSGTPTAPTATAGTSTTQIATTAYVATSYAPLASPTFTGTVNTAALTSTGNFTPSQTNGIVGTTTNNNANAGSVGEFVSATASSISLPTNTPTNITSMSLTAGDWDVSASIGFTTGTTNLTLATGGTSTTSATFGSIGTVFQYAGPALNGYTNGIPVNRLSLSSTTTVYCVASAVFSSGSVTGSCLLRARRVR